jgi:hypothetical protein
MEATIGHPSRILEGIAKIPRPGKHTKVRVMESKSEGYFVRPGKNDPERGTRVAGGKISSLGAKDEISDHPTMEG